MPGNDLKQSVQVNLEGNLESRSRSYEQALKRMADRGAKNITLMSRATHAAGRGLDRLGNRYTGLITGATVAFAVKQVGDLEERYTRLGIAADLSDAQVQALKKSIFDIAQAPDISVDPGEVISAVEAIVEKTGDLKFAQDNIRNIGLVMQATGAAGADVGELLAELQKQGITSSREVLRAVDVLNAQGKAGAFTLQELARLGPRVVTAYAAAGRTGVGAMRELGAALQVIRMGTGSSEQAATAFEAVMRTLADPKKIKQLKELGNISVFDPEMLKQGKQQLRPINELMVEIIKKSGGKQTNLAQIFDAEAMRAFNAAASEFNRTGNVESLERFMSVMADGQTTINDSRRAAGTFNSAMTSLRTSWAKFADDNLTEPVREFAGWIKSLDKDTVSLALNTGKWVVGIGAALVAGRKIFKLYKGIAGLVRAGGAAGTAASVAGSLKPIPVYVVNNVGGLGGGKMGGAGKVAAGAGMGMLGSAGMVAGAGVAGYGVGSLLRDPLVNFDEKYGIGGGNDRLGKLMAYLLSPFSDEASASIERDKKYQAHLEVSVKDDRVNVTQVDGDDGFDIDADDGLNLWP